ncbi:AraC family transcriptional regulator [Paenibacillus alkaliterrae]|uniref:AraC family transcriptional regulator n=1 Tax=Paenibacillus alkaliterrae TaxID=320909 RepID=UPI001F23C40B|nr:AraC family transcriptional regulator [Paenibacillus alkaliterrae]MCF2936953.1 AraC family transcriptional regulator [Paenibacillus alkaliterrae]
MKRLTEMTVYLRSAHTYSYTGSIHEETRVGHAFAFHLFVQGKGIMFVEGKKYEVGKGSLLFIRPGQAHSFHHNPGLQLEAFNIYSDLWEIPGSGSSTFSFQTDSADPRLLTLQEICPELDELPTHAMITPYPDAVDLFIQICGLHGSAGFYSEEMSANLMAGWLMRFYNIVRERQPRDYRIMHVLEEIDRSPERQFHYADWCRRYGLEKTHFYKLFRSVTGMTPKAYQLKQKMTKASVLLLESNQSVTSIAEQLGYDSIHYFSKQFADVIGVPPSTYRLRNRGGSLGSFNFHGSR